MYELNQYQKNFIVSHKIDEIIASIGITSEELAKKTNIEYEEIKSFFAGNYKLPPADVQKIIRAVSLEIQEIFDFAEYPQIHEDVNGYISADELEYSYSI